MPTTPNLSEMEEKLEERFKVYVANYAKPPTIKANLRRLDEFFTFAQELFLHRGQKFSKRASLSDDTAARLFLVLIADQKLGKTVVSAVCTMLQTHRELAHPGIVPLRKLRAVQFLLDAIDKNIISTDHQAPGLTAMHVTMVLRNWGNSIRWDEVMMSAVVGIGFQATLRPIEITFLGSRAVWWILQCGREVRSNFRRRPPSLPNIRGIIMALLPRKNRQGKMSYLPSPAGLVVSAMHRHATNMHKLCPDASFFFPARMQPRATKKRYTWHQKSRWVPNPANPFAQRSISDVAIPTALLYCCNIKRKDSAIFTGYSLRVGGTTHHEESGTTETVRKNLAEWMSLATARHYLQHSPSTQFRHLEKAAL
jgi:hypothetical protein